MRARTFVAALALFLAAYRLTAADRYELTIDWSQLPKNNTYTIRADAKTRVTETTSVVLHVTHFNFLRYGIEVAVHEKVLESYVYLNKLWQAVLLLPSPTARTFIAGDVFTSALIEWREDLRSANQAVDRALAKYPGVALDADDEKKIDADAAALQARVNDLEKKRAVVLNALKMSTEVDRIPFFDATDREHTAVVERITAFVNTNELLHKGWTKTIDRRDAGRVVTVTLTPKNKITGSDGEPVTVEYFVNSATPVYYHVGAAYNTVRDVRFEQVQTLAGNNLWEKVRDSNGTASLAAFLSYPLGRRLSTNWSPALTLGTDFSKPGDHLYVGLSIPYQRFVASIGLISASQNQAGNPIIEQIVNTPNTRVLYDAFRSRRVWKPAIALTIKPFDR